MKMQMAAGTLGGGNRFHVHVVMDPFFFFFLFFRQCGDGWKEERMDRLRVEEET